MEGTLTEPVSSACAADDGVVLTGEHVCMMAAVVVKKYE